MASSAGAFGAVTRNDQEGVVAIGERPDGEVDALFGNQGADRDGESGVVLDVEFCARGGPFDGAGGREPLAGHRVGYHHDLVPWHAVVTAHDPGSGFGERDDACRSPEKRLGAQSSGRGSSPEQRVADLPIHERCCGSRQCGRTGEQSRRTVSDDHIEVERTSTKRSQCRGGSRTLTQCLDVESVSVSPGCEGDCFDIAPQLLQPGCEVHRIYLRAASITVGDHLQDP